MYEALTGLLYVYGNFQTSGLQFDSLTSTMLILMTSVSALVHIYSTDYMSDDPHIPQFMPYLLS